MILEAGAAGLAALYSNGRVDPVEVARFYLDRIAARNGALNACLDITAAGAMAQAAASLQRWRSGRPLSPLDGVPVAVKANIAVRGLPWHAGIAAYRDRSAPRDAACVSRLKQSGAILLGLTNMDEAALGATGDNAWFGRTENPLAKGFTAGGSSAGAAAAVAGGLAAIAIGTDTMGSVRIPAAYCGLVGYKPSRGLISLAGIIPLARRLDHVGVLGRSLEDCALVAGLIRKSPPMEPRPTGPGWTLAVIDWAAEPNLDPEILRALDQAADRASTAGALIRQIPRPPFELRRWRLNALLICEHEAYRTHRHALDRDPDGFGTGLRGLLTWGAAQTPTRIAAARTALNAAARHLRALLERDDVLLLPATAQTAFPFTAAVPTNQADYTLLANIAGCPSVVIRAGYAATGLPLSVQLIGRDDERLLHCANRLAQALA